MAKIELNNLSSGYNINAINVNFGKIETEFKDKVVYRNEASPMARDLDLNGFGVINLRDPVTNGDAISYGFLLNSDAFSFTGLEYKGLWAPVIAYAKNNYVTSSGFVYIAQEAHTSSTDFLTDVGEGKWVVFSAGGGDLLSTNNLSDLSSISTARVNLNVPSRTGENASGNWNINAATAALATLATDATNADNANAIDGISSEQLVKQTSVTGSAQIPVGTTAQRDLVPAAGFFRFNSTTGFLEIYTGSSWDSYSAPPDASTTVKGIIEIATTAEAQAGTDSVRAITPQSLKSAQIQLATSITAAAQTSIDFTAIPSWAKRITLLFAGLSTNGTSPPMVQIGDSGGFETSSYIGSASSVSTGSTSATNFTTGFGILDAMAASVVLNGSMTICLITGTTWIANGTIGRSDIGATGISGGAKTLSGVLDRIRLTTVGGVNQFDAGIINILYE